MTTSTGRRERRKRETRHQLGDVAARLFAEHGYDAVSVSDVARAAGVAEQTVYNYFPTKPDLVLERADEILARTRQAVAERRAHEVPADALRALVHEDVARYVADDGDLARGEFPAQSQQSPVLRRRALEYYDDLAEAITSALAEAAPAPPRLVHRTHAAALVAVVQATTTGIGAAVLSGADREDAARRLLRDADAALDHAASWSRVEVEATTPATEDTTS